MAPSSENYTRLENSYREKALKSTCEYMDAVYVVCVFEPALINGPQYRAG